jgi:hypothetical protein
MRKHTTALHGMVPQWRDYVDDTVAIAFGDHTLTRGGGRFSEFKREDSPWIVLYQGFFIYDLHDAEHDITTDQAHLQALLKRYGWDFWKRLRGEYVLLVYHTEERVMRLYRDSSGAYTLFYYTDILGNFIVSSELRALTEHPLVQTSLDPQAVSLAMLLGYIPSTRTMIDDVVKVAVGSIVTFDCKKRELSRTPMEFSLYGGEDYTSYQPLIASQVTQRRDLGLVLDGSFEAALLLEHLSRDRKDLITYSIRYERGDPHGETIANDGERLSKHYGTHHEEIYITADEYRLALPRALEIVQEPFHFYHTVDALFIMERAHACGTRNLMLPGAGDALTGSALDSKQSLLCRFATMLSPTLRNALLVLHTGREYDFTVQCDRWFYRTSETTPYAAPAIPYKKISDELREQVSALTPLYSELDVLLPLIRDSHCIERVLIQAPLLSSVYARLSQALGMVTWAPCAERCVRGILDSYRRTHDRYYYQLPNTLGGIPDWYHTYTRNELQQGINKPPLLYWYDKKWRDTYLSLLGSKRTSDVVAWARVRSIIEARGDLYPGDKIAIYLSLAALMHRYSVAT